MNEISKDIEKPEAEKPEAEKNELEKPIILDEKRVVIGMTGGIDSTVAAFLLKKRGLQCIGISIVFLDEDKIKETILAIIRKEEAAKENVFKKTEEGKKDIQ
ncbi:MAG: hypothetical protein HQK53_14815, partial [Oligoflexia bacterium]|nr:hypothetical protein [Oligoflexia bacterium]